jgi:phosphoserine phosphatase
MIKLICMDMDGVLTQWTNFWLKLHETWGTKEEGYELTKQYLRTDYKRLMEEVLDRLWIGKPESPHQDLVRSVLLSEGIQAFFTELGRFQVNHAAIPRAIISSGPYQLAFRIKEEFGIDFIFANELIFEQGFYKGKYHFNMRSEDEYKVNVVRQLCDDLEILPQEVLYIGDDDSDMAAFKEVGISIAFNAKSEDLKKAATYIVESNNLADVIPILEKIRKETGVGSPTFEPGTSP